jgi:hypothetical protein
MNDLTVIYYTSNREKPKFEKRITRSLRHSSRPAPIISVSQKPMDFGENICVGDVGRSSQNAWRQLQIGCKAAKTRFVCAAESDFLYPKEYFRFTPPRDDAIYCGKPVYILYSAKTHWYFRMRISEAVTVTNREYMIEILEEQLKDKPEWRPTLELKVSDAKKKGIHLPDLFTGYNVEYFSMETPAVTFKTNENMHRKSTHHKAGALRELPYWGNSLDLIRRYCR